MLLGFCCWGVGKEGLGMEELVRMKDVMCHSAAAFCLQTACDLGHGEELAFDWHALCIARTSSTLPLALRVPSA